MTGGAAAPPSAAAEGAWSGRLTAAATTSAVVAVMPAFLTGASSVLLSEDFGIAPSDVGLAVGAFFTASAVAAPLGGRLADRWGATRSLIQVTTASAVVLAGIAALVTNLAGLLAAMALGGVINGFAQPATALALVGGGVGRQGLLFGVKQSAIPLATLFAGATVPLIGVDHGWRWAFAIAATAALSFIWLPASLHTRNRGRTVGQPRRMDMTLPRILPLVFAMGIGTAAATAIGVYLVPTAVSAGVSLGTAGWLLVWGSMAGVAARLAGGWLADHRGSDGLGIIGGMLVIGAAGYAAFAFEDPLWIVAATLVAYAFGWGWTGLMNYAVVRLNPSSPATAAGILQTGGAAGAAIGPILFGQILSHTSYPVAWLASAAGLLAAALLILALKVQLSRAD